MKFSTGTPARLALALSFSLVLAACGNGGGGGSSAQNSGVAVPPVPGSATYMVMYQGNWLQKAVQPLPYIGQIGPESVRERRIFSAPDANGKITIEKQVEYFDSTITATDYTTVPYATLKTDTPFSAVYARTQTQASIFAGASHDVLTVTGVGSTVSATPGTAAPVAITQETVSGIPSWRVTFTSGRSVVQARNEGAGTIEIQLMTSAVNGVPNSELAINGFAQSFIKR